MVFEILLTDGTTEHTEADGYALEGPLTTFFRAQAGRAPRLDPWAVRLLSIRTERVARITAVDEWEGVWTADRSAGSGVGAHSGRGLQVV